MSVIYKNARCVDALDAKVIESKPLNFKTKAKKVLNILKTKNKKLILSLSNAAGSS